eukprot:1149313-Pelagomonas_calceolata.AAC.1
MANDINPPHSDRSLCSTGSMQFDRPTDVKLLLHCRFVLFMLPKLTSLDTLVLADETKHLAEATFLKKQMYYNMRIKTVFRNARNIIRQANEGKKVGKERVRALYAIVDWDPTHMFQIAAKK